MIQQNKIHILLVEDNQGDVVLTTEALEDSKINFRMSVVRDGKAAINFMSLLRETSGETAVNLVLLDINIPKKNGQEVLKFIKGSEMLKHIPVIMLTTSSSQKDRDQSALHHANFYIVKPLGSDQVLQMVSSIRDEKKTASKN